MMIRGSVDEVTSTEVRGWAFSPGRKEPVLVQAVLNHEILGEARANIHRADLAAAGVGDGNSGYQIKLFRPIDPLYVPFLVVKVEGGDAELPRAPVLGFRDFFTSLFVNHPAAGRPRSVFGGLWTERTDAASVLRGKLATGQLRPAVEEPLRHLISDGFALIGLRTRPGAVEWKSNPAGWVADALEDEELLPVLHAAFEDNLLVVKAAYAEKSAHGLAQPSNDNPSPSPAECLQIVIPMEEGVSIDMVRDSHRLPEFTAHGISRWASRAGSDGLSIAGLSGLLATHAVPLGSAAVIGAGSLFRIRCEVNSACVKILALPARAQPLSLAEDPKRQELKRPTGTLVWL